MTDSDKTSEEQLLKTDAIGRVRTTPQQREGVLDAYEASGLSGPEFARVHGINYQTFATWRHKRKKARSGDGGGVGARLEAGQQHGLTLVEVAAAVGGAGQSAASILRIELPGGARLEVSHAEQAMLAAQVLAALGAQPGGRSC